jgi:small subunit ribosomal protein S16
MVRIRLLRVGAIRQPSYRIVVADQRSPRDGRFIEIIGNYNPRTEPATVVVDRERALYWLSQGAQPSDAVARMLEKTSVMAIHRGETTLEAVEGQDTETEAPAAAAVPEAKAEQAAEE